MVGGWYSSRASNVKIKISISTPHMVGVLV